ncbi:MAG: chloride channel protein [Actinomycetota bacterium]|jgi:hypothetical protein|nr:chloride channel protein [Actinomycetota bacterium]
MPTVPTPVVGPFRLFTPTFSFGAVLGLTLGHLWAMAWPGASLDTYAVIGAGGLIGTAMEAPVAGIAFTVELTGTTTVSLVVVALALAGALLVSRRLVNLSIYSARIAKPTAAPFATDAARPSASPTSPARPSEGQQARRDADGQAPTREVASGWRARWPRGRAPLTTRDRRGAS